eukprot:gnl/TRDRNA2_/TRDRNA2_175706_c0_seq5.p2 gnl/TRDRNA2_/TRDRNA2_175706_c0~~gnl/TRDRNA2_/TRDRNA2_175706_c0_seq5.p2  ORF type:complete len:151 (-),score=20.15 gnl/TRDRNA2_/TRDRNA2_175706_c0_seq5:153-605(-)
MRNSFSSNMSFVARTQAAFARFCAPRSSVVIARAAKSVSVDWSTLASAQTMLTRSDGSRLLTCSSTALAAAANSFSSGRLRWAKAQAALTRFCVLKLPPTAAAASAANKFSSDRPVEAHAHAMLTRFYWLNLLSRCAAATASTAKSFSLG